MLRPARHPLCRAGVLLQPLPYRRTLPRPVPPHLFPHAPPSTKPATTSPPPLAIHRGQEEQRTPNLTMPRLLLPHRHGEWAGSDCGRVCGGLRPSIRVSTTFLFSCDFASNCMEVTTVWTTACVMQCSIDLCKFASPLLPLLVTFVVQWAHLSVSKYIFN